MIFTDIGGTASVKCYPTGAFTDRGSLAIARPLLALYGIESDESR